MTLLVALLVGIAIGVGVGNLLTEWIHDRASRRRSQLGLPGDRTVHVQLDGYRRRSS